jgi:flagellar protein FlbB
MTPRRRRTAASVAVVLVLVLLPCSSSFRNRLTAENLTSGSAAGKHAAAYPTASSATGSMQKRSEILERETAVSIKEQEMRKIGQSLESRMKQLEEAKKAYETALEQKKKDDTEKYQKMIKVYKGLKPAAAAALLDKLDEGLAMELLNRMDQKTVVKLIPLLNQERVLKWTRLSLKND